MIRPRYFPLYLLLFGLLITGYGPADAQGGRDGGHGVSHNNDFSHQNSQANPQIPLPGTIPRTIPGGLGNVYSQPPPNPGGGPRAMTPMVPGYASPYAGPPAGQVQYSCTINANQPEAGGACIINSSTRKFSGGRCSCHRQVGTID